MSTTTPTLIFIPGGWHTAAVWDKVIKLMEAQGHTCIGVNLPSCSSNPSATFYDDTQAVRGVILAETNDKNRNVVLVTWSYGGQVASSAIRGLTSTTTTTTTDTSTQEEADGTDKKPQGRILGLALIASGFTTTGVSFLAATNNTPPPFLTPNTTTGFAALVADPKDLFYHDLPLPEAQYWESQLTQLSLKALAEGGEHS
jgi:pimeloyl-ACP methyl ester carboxylesterase